MSDVGILEIIGDALIIGYGAVLAFFFFEFWYYGKVWAFEPNSWIAFTELVITIGFILLGINRLKEDLKRKNR